MLAGANWTAEIHVSRAMVELGARERAQIVVYAYEFRLARPLLVGKLTVTTMSSSCHTVTALRGMPG